MSHPSTPPAGAHLDPVPHHDVAIIGAGPYGLSIAAHLIARGRSVVVFGKPLELWREHMPAGMHLRSHWWASNLSDREGAFTLDRFLREQGRPREYPLPIQAFIDYGLWFQARAVPVVDQAYVSGIARGDRGFRLRLADRRVVDARAVVVATGLHAYAHRADPGIRLPPGMVSHACDHRDLSRFRGQTVVVVGAGQSAIESAALLNEAGATVHVVSRRPVHWLEPDREDERGLLDRVRAPRNGIAPGWKNWALEHWPYLFYRAPQPRKDRWNRTCYLSAAADWLRGRVLGRVTLHEGCTIADAVAACCHATVLRLSSGAVVRAHHVMLATGYRAHIDRLAMLDPGLRRAIRTEAGVPALSASFETTVPDLYFVGFTALRAFGPLYRFVAGCTPTAYRVAAAI